MIPLRVSAETGEPPSATDAPRQRADARRNRARVLDAAEALLSERGPTVQIEEIARRAGVGVGTVCRNFATKDALVEAVLTSMYEALLGDAEAALGAADPATGFEQFVEALSQFHARHHALAEQMADELVLPAAAHRLRDALRGAIGELLQRAQAAGVVRADVGPADVAMLFAGVAHAAALAGDLQPTLRERYVRLILDGLRPLAHDVASAPLPGVPLDFAALQRGKASAAAARRGRVRGARPREAAHGE